MTALDSTALGYCDRVGDEACRKMLCKLYSSTDSVGLLLLSNTVKIRF